MRHRRPRFTNTNVFEKRVPQTCVSADPAFEYRRSPKAGSASSTSVLKKRGTYSEHASAPTPIFKYEMSMINVNQ
ncbi:hypothetical protein [Choristoneura occidentalis alphabaculovirus]|nr:hypothetical protein [Choristoneura occidentalis alphabaculovirus]